MPTARRHHRRSLGALTAAAATAALLSGCTPASEPLPTPAPLFATEQEAYAAAEETYRAYNDAMNTVRLDEPRTFERPLEYLGRDLANSERQNLTNLHALGASRTGNTTITSVRDSQYDNEAARVTLEICVDVHEVVLIDATGQSLASPTRPSTYGLNVVFAVGARDRVQIINSTNDGSVPCP